MIENLWIPLIFSDPRVDLRYFGPKLELERILPDSLVIPGRVQDPHSSEDPAHVLELPVNRVKVPFDPNFGPKYLRPTLGSGEIIEFQ